MRLKGKAISFLRLLIFASILTPLTLVSSTEAQLLFSGRAFGVTVAPPVLATIVLSDTGELPAEGGSRENSMADLRSTGDHYNVVAATVVTRTAGAGLGASSSAETSDFAATLTSCLASAHVTADELRAVSSVSCLETSGTVIITNLQVDGQEIVVSGEPNQQVNLPGLGMLIINEQIVGLGEITVNALHFQLDAIIDVVVSSARSGIGSCALAVEESRWGAVKSLYAN
jgi:hypothetical protein